MTEAITKKTAPKSAATTEAKPEVKVDLTKPNIKDAMAQGLALLKEGKTKADAALILPSNTGHSIKQLV